jgi:hypothetical protein
VQSFAQNLLQFHSDEDLSLCIAIINVEFPINSLIIFIHYLYSLSGIFEYFHDFPFFREPDELEMISLRLFFHAIEQTSRKMGKAKALGNR